MDKYFVKTETNEIFGGPYANEDHATTYAANIKKKIGHQYKQFIVATSKKQGEGVVTILSDTTFTATSSHGKIFADAITGNIVAVNGASYLTDIKRLDVDEWKKTYPSKQLVGEIDILDFGMWMKDGSYDEPAHDWRKETRRI